MPDANAKKLNEYENGDKISDGRAIEQVLSADERYLIAYMKDGSLAVLPNLDDYSKIGDHLAKFDSLYTKIERSVPERDQKVLFGQLAKCLTWVFDYNGNPPPLTIFNEVELHLQSICTAQASKYYVLGAIQATAYTVALISLLWIVSGVFGHDFLVLVRRGSLIIKGALVGSLGACCTVLIRSGTLKIDPYAEANQYLFQGALRIGLGVFFGVIAVLAIMGDVAFGMANANGNRYIFWLAVFVSGFSEVLIPEFLSNLEKTSQTGTTPAGAGAAGGTPAGGTPAGGTPAGGTPAGGTPAGGTPAGGTPAGGQTNGAKKASTAEESSEGEMAVPPTSESLPEGSEKKDGTIG